MKVLVTGAGGFLGPHVVERLLAHGETHIRCLIRSQAGKPTLERLAAQYPEARVEIVQGSLTSKLDAARVSEGVSTVYHLAAAMGGAAAEMVLNTVVGTKHLLESMAERGPFRLVLVSSLGVYGVSGMPSRAMVDENTPLEPHPERRDPYSFTKWRQEKLVQDLRERIGFDCVILRPGVIYGPKGPEFSGRVGLNVFGVFLHIGGGNPLPLTYVENCAEAIVVVGRNKATSGNVYNVVDDEIPTCGQYLKAYRRYVNPLRTVRIPYFVMKRIATAVEWYSRYSRGQLPAIFTPYKAAAAWKGNRFTNARLKQAGWKPAVSTAEGMKRAFEWMKANPR